MPAASTRRKSLALMLRRSSPAESRIRIATGSAAHREADGELLWKPFPGGHELNPEALELARAWFDALLSGATALEYGEDDTMQIIPDIDIEFRNPLYTPQIRKLWLK